MLKKLIQKFLDWIDPPKPGYPGHPLRCGCMQCEVIRRRR